MPVLHYCISSFDFWRYFMKNVTRWLATINQEVGQHWTVAVWGDIEQWYPFHGNSLNYSAYITAISQDVCVLDCTLLKVSVPQQPQNFWNVPTTFALLWPFFAYKPVNDNFQMKKLMFSSSVNICTNFVGKFSACLWQQAMWKIFKFTSSWSDLDI